MRKIGTGLLLLSLVIGGCQKKIADTIGGKTPDERLSAALAAYQTKLTSATDGWILVEYTTGSALNQGATTTGPAAAFAYYMQFTDSNQVTMFSDFDSTMSVPNVSSYRIKAVQRPSLIFDTYSYIHVPCDPDPNISKSPFGPGLGWGTDFEFSFADNVSADQLGDTIHLTGNLNSVSAILVKATPAQKAAYYDGTFANSFVFDKILTYFKRLTAGSTVVEFTPGLANHVVDINWLSGSTLQSIATNYYVAGGSIFFVKPASVGSQTISQIDNIVWNPVTSKASVSVNGTTGVIAGTIAPLKNNPSAPTQWYDAAYNAQSLYGSFSGFHVNGVDDAFGVTALQYNGLPFYAYLYYPDVLSGGYDLLSPFFASNTAGAYPDYITAAFEQTINGQGFFGIGPPTTAPDAVVNTNDMIYNNGFYFVLKEDGSSYDMVSSTDAQAWIDWQILQ